MKPSTDFGADGPGGWGGNRASVPSIEIKNITVRFEGKMILEDFSLHVNSGEKVVLTGESGLGKSTVLRSVLGFVIPVEGSIFINGQPLSPETVWRLRTFLAYVPQEPNLGSGPLREWLERPFTYRANSGLRKNLDRIPELFDRFLLSMDLLEKEVSTLSGGEKQRVALVSAILLDRKIFLLDEPTSALDDSNRDRMMDYLRSIPDRAVLAVSHDPALLALADRVVRLS